MKTTQSILIGLLTFASALSHAQSKPVSVSGKVVAPTKSSSAANDVVLWLMPKDEAAVKNTPPAEPQKARLTQKNKTFHPRLLVLPAGSTVEFPNKDPFFHNVFSLFNGKRFDLGLYEAGESRTARFERVGVSYIFCNIHPEMSAIIVTLNTPYYAASNDAGEFAIAGVAPGVYELHIFADGLSAEAQSKLVREVRVNGENLSLADISIPDRQQAPHHMNKFGHEYESHQGSPYEH